MTAQLLHPIIMSLIPKNIDMNNAIEEIKKLYFQPTLTPYTIYFERIHTLRYAFFYRHFICVSNAVCASWKKLLEHRLELFDLTKKPVIDICCIGGGNGSDLVGFCQFLDSINVENNLNAVILDYFNWEETKRLLDKIAIKHGRNINKFKFVRLDPTTYFTLKNSKATAEERVIAKEEERKILIQIRKADLVTLVQYLSSAGGRHFENKERLGKILCHVKPGAFVFIMDSNAGPYSILTESTLDEAGFTLLSVVKNLDTVVSEEESKEMDRNLFSELVPEKSLVVSTHLWQKNI